MRLDLFLTAARLFKRRTEAQRRATAGSVRLNGQAAKPAHPVKVGDRIQITYARWEVELEIREIPMRSLPKERAAELYELIERRTRNST